MGFLPLNRDFLRASTAPWCISTCEDHLGFPRFHLHPWFPLREAGVTLHAPPVLLCLLFDAE